MLASQPGEVLANMSFDGLPRIFDSATIFLTPWFAPYIGAAASAELAEWLARVVLSYFFTPSRSVDLGDAASAQRFIEQFVLPAFPSQKAAS